MIGAGAVALWQMGREVRGRNTPGGAPGGTAGLRTFATGYLSFAGAAALVAVLTGLVTGMGVAGVLAFSAFAAAAALISELLVGVSAMHSGWFPAFATSLIFLLLGMLLGFPPLALVVLAGFASATGPAFADMGYDLKAGWILRGEGKDPDYERQGRRAQRAAEVFGLLVASGLVLLTYASYFEADLFPPYDRVAVATIAAGQNPGLAGELALWTIPGAIVQFLGGPSRQMGVLFATGLLIVNPVAGWTALAALLLRRLVSWRTGTRFDAPALHPRRGTDRGQCSDELLFGGRFGDVQPPVTDGYHGGDVPRRSAHGRRTGRALLPDRRRVFGRTGRGRAGADGGGGRCGVRPARP